MRKPLIAGNWKMNTTAASGAELAAAVAAGAGDLDAVDLLVCPPSVYLAAVKSAVGDAAVAVGAQNMYHEASGAFTGELSADMLKDVGCTYVILGHSERRTLFGETDELINKKVKYSLANGLRPIFCVGETLAEREAGQVEAVLTRQINYGLSGVDDAGLAKTVIAYEPVW
ncbi:MAG: triose-phosphate isomerase, partial [Planctomycetales bacterium]|nr:triose-phosphate isomerase [Planctomycetales bacterium]